MSTPVDPGARVTPETTPVTFRLPVPDLEVLDAMAKWRSISRSELLTRIVGNMLGIRALGIVPDSNGTLVKIQEACAHEIAPGTNICGNCGLRAN